MTDYAMLKAQAESLLEDETEWLPAFANMAAALYETLDDINWAGFYFLKPAQKNAETAIEPQLVLGPFQGKVACARIPYGKGVCGAAVANDLPQLVRDVHTFQGHIACDAASQSELVFPLHANGAVVGVLDLDAPVLARFTEKDMEGMQGVVDAIEDWMKTTRVQIVF